MDDPTPPPLPEVPLIRLRGRFTAWDDAPPPEGYDLPDTADDDADDDADDPAPRWTVWRVLTLLVLILTLLAFITYTLAPLITSFTQPAPPPPLILPGGRA